MKTILVATDFSQAANNAACYAADMAKSIDANVYLLHVYQVPAIYLEVPVAVSETGMHQDLELEMNKLIKRLHQLTGGKLSIDYELRMGVFFPELQSVCKRLHPYTVVMGSQGSTAALRMLFGSHSIYTMKHLSWPLITVPLRASFTAIKKIGLACDLEEVENTIPVEEIKTLVHDFNAELHVLNTGSMEQYNANSVFESAELEALLKPVKPQFHFIAHDNIDAGVLEFADKNNIDLLVTIPKRHSLLDELIHKSHSKQMVLHSHVPVMALHQ
jgi:nucleotide-binding universal stress UspA family protein